MAHFIAVGLCGVAAGLFVTRHGVAGGVVLALEAIVVLWSLEISRSSTPSRTEKRP